VGGGYFQRSLNRLQHAIEIIENLVVPKSDDAIAMRRKLGTAPLVCRHLLAMLAAIEFDHQLARGTGKVGDASADRMLTTKLPWRKALAQATPQHSFDIRGISAEAPRDLCSRSHRHRCPHLILTFSAPKGGEGITTPLTATKRDSI
jgi:hypothetical protein